jgi:hypothetical protein
MVTIEGTVFWVRTPYSFGDSPTFQRNMSSPSSWLKSKGSKEPAEAGGKLSLAYSSTLKTEATCPSETTGCL